MKTTNRPMQSDRPCKLSFVMESLESRQLLSASVEAAASGISKADLRWINAAANNLQLSASLANLTALNASSQQVKAAGSAILTEQAAISPTLADDATTLGITLNSTLTKQSQARVNRLTKMVGAKFDRAYSQTALAIDNQEIANYRSEIKHTDTALLSTYATDNLPTLIADRSLFQSTAKSVRTTANARSGATTPTPITQPITPITTTPVLSTGGGTTGIGNTLGTGSGTDITSSGGSVLDGIGTTGSGIAGGIGDSTFTGSTGSLLPDAGTTTLSDVSGSIAGAGGLNATTGSIVPISGSPGTIAAGEDINPTGLAGTIASNNSIIPVAGAVNTNVTNNSIVPTAGVAQTTATGESIVPTSASLGTTSSAESIIPSSNFAASDAAAQSIIPPTGGTLTGFVETGDTAFL